MTDDCFDETFERFLAGRPVPAEAAFLEVFANGVHAVATHPGRPNPQLAELLATGLPIGRGTAVVRSVRGPGILRPSRQPRRRTLLGSLAAAAAKVASAGAVAQAATGLGIVLASATGAGAAGVLPDPIQGQVSGVLEVVTPVDLPDASDETSATKKGPATEDGDTAREPADGDSPAGAPAQAEFGRRASKEAASEEARRGGVDGDVVSGQARDRHRPEVPAGSARQQPATERPTPASPHADRPGTRGRAVPPASPAAPPSSGHGRP
jgi:hypothetical protein